MTTSRGQVGFLVILRAKCEKNRKINGFKNKRNVDKKRKKKYYFDKVKIEIASLIHLKKL